MNQIFSLLIQFRCRNESVLENGDDCVEKEEEHDVPTQLLQTPKINLLVCRITCEEIATFFLCSASRAQNTVLIYLKKIYCPSSLMNEVLNQC